MEDFFTPPKFIDSPALKQMEQIIVRYIGSDLIITPYIDEVAQSAFSALTAVSGKWRVANLSLADGNNEFKNGRVIKLKCSSTTTARIQTWDCAFTPLIAGSDQASSSWDVIETTDDFGDKNIEKEWQWLTIAYRGTPTVVVYNNNNSIIFNDSLPASTARTSFQLNLTGNYGHTLRWTYSGNAAGAIYSHKLHALSLAA